MAGATSNVGHVRVEAAKQAFVDALAARIVADYLREIAPANQADAGNRTNHPPLPGQRAAA
jgi:hypothetical protein